MNYNVRMRNALLLSVLLFCMIRITNTRIINKEPLSPRLTNYKIEAKPDPVTKTVHGFMDAFRANNSSENVTDIQMHLYAIAYKNNITIQS